jgi:hypothetical protein
MLVQNLQRPLLRSPASRDNSDTKPFTQFPDCFYLSCDFLVAFVSWRVLILSHQET